MAYILNGVKDALADEYEAALESLRHGRTDDWANYMRTVGFLDGLDRALSAIEEVERCYGAGGEGVAPSLL